MCKKQKPLNLGSRLPDLGIFELEFNETIVIFKISTLKFIKSESLTNTVNFRRGSAFSEGPGLGLLRKTPLPARAGQCYTRVNYVQFSRLVLNK